MEVGIFNNKTSLIFFQTQELEANMRAVAIGIHILLQSMQIMIKTRKSTFWKSEINILKVAVITAEQPPGSRNTIISTWLFGVFICKQKITW